MFVEHARDFVNRVHIPHGNHAPQGHVGEQRNFVALFGGNGPVGAAHQRVGLDADFAQLLGGMLGGFGLELACGGNPGDVAQVHKGAVVSAELQAELAHRLQERQGLDVAHGAADFDDGHIHRVRLTEARAAFDKFLDLIGDMRNHLHGFTQVIAAALFVEHALVNLSGGEIVGLSHAGLNKTLVMAQIQVGLRAVVGDKNLAVLQRRHGARIDVEIGVQLN